MKKVTIASNRVRKFIHKKKTERSNENSLEDHKSNDVPNKKRSAESSPEDALKKRSVLGNITNAVVQVQKPVKQVAKKSKTSKSEDDESSCDINLKPRDSLETSLYVTAVEDKGENHGSILESEDEDKTSWSLSQSIKEEDVSITEMNSSICVPPAVEDFDKANRKDYLAESTYAHSIFTYFKRREAKFKIKPYMEHQSEVTPGMRAILVDWMVEVQENFELNHETLYLAVKLVDHYLMKNPIPKNILQLIGATSIFIACKFDERCPPLLDDFIYICDDSYSKRELLAMEINILKSVNFELGMPLSYRFLRRYARCSKTALDTLTLARYILESSLLEYDLISESDSLIAAASLLLAFKMKDLGDWTPTLEYYSEYKESDLTEMVSILNDFISPPFAKHLQTIRSKYSHKVFFEVAKIPPLQMSEDV